MKVKALRSGLLVGEDPQKVAERVKRILGENGTRAVALSEDEAPTRKHAQEIAKLIGPNVVVEGGCFEGEDIWLRLVL